MSDNNATPEVKFDPMTGEPINRNAKDNAEEIKPSESKEKLTKTNHTGNSTDIFKSGMSKLSASINYYFSKDFLGNLFKKKWAKAVLIVLIVIVVLSMALLAFASTPKNSVVLSAFRTVNAVSHEKSVDERVLGISDFVGTFSKGSTVQELELEDEETKVSAQCIKQGKYDRSVYATVNKDDDVIADLYIYDDEEKRVFGAPELYDDIFVYNKGKDSEQYNSLINSVTKPNIGINSLFGSVGDGVAGAAAVGITASGAQKAAAMSRTVLSQLNYVDVYKQISVEKGESSKIEINNDTVKCKSYKLTIPKSVIKQCINIVSKEMDKTDAVVGLIGQINGNMTAQDKKEIRKQINDVLENISDEAKDLDIDVYTYKGRIVQYEYKMTVYESTLKNTIKLSATGNPLDNVEVTAKVETNNNDSEAVFKIDTEYNKKTEDYSKNIEVKIDNGVELGMSNKLEYNKESGGLTDKMTLISPLGDFSVVSLDADINNIKKGKSLDIEINKLRFGEDDSELELKGSYSFKAKSEDLKVEKSSIDVSDMSNKEIATTSEKIRTKLNKRMDKLDEGVVKYYYSNYFSDDEDDESDFDLDSIYD